MPKSKAKKPKGRPRGKPVKKHVFKDPTIEEIVEVWVDFVCPVRGKIKQKVKIKKLKKASGDSVHVVSTKDELEGIEDDGLSIYEGNPDEDVE